MRKLQRNPYPKVDQSSVKKALSLDSAFFVEKKPINHDVIILF